MRDVHPATIELEPSCSRLDYAPKIYAPKIYDSANYRSTQMMTQFGHLNESLLGKAYI